MYIGREHRGWRDGKPAIDKVQFCLRKMEEAQCWSRVDKHGRLDWTDELVPGCTLEEVVGALLHAEEELSDA